MDELTIKLKELFSHEYDSPDYIKILKNGKNFTIEVGQMYRHLTFNLSMLIDLGDLLGTRNIDLDQDSYGGCETCDWGSNYWHEITIKNATKNVEELTKLATGKDLLERK